MERSTKYTKRTKQKGDIFEVKKIVGDVKVGGRQLYKVRWKGYGVMDDTYEPRENLFSCEDILEEYIRMKHERIAAAKLSHHEKAPSSSSTSSSDSVVDTGAVSVNTGDRHNNSSSSSSSVYNIHHVTTNTTPTTTTTTTDRLLDTTNTTADVGMGVQDMCVDEISSTRHVQSVSTSTDERGVMLSGVQKSRTRSRGTYYYAEDAEPVVKDTFWEDLEKGNITFTGDMYSKVKTGRQRRSHHNSETETVEGGSSKKSPKTKSTSPGASASSNNRHSSGRAVKRKQTILSKVRKDPVAEAIGSLDAATKQSLESCSDARSSSTSSNPQTPQPSPSIGGATSTCNYVASCKELNISALAEDMKRKRSLESSNGSHVESYPILNLDHPDDSSNDEADLSDSIQPLQTSLAIVPPLSRLNLPIVNEPPTPPSEEMLHRSDTTIKHGWKKSGGLDTKLIDNERGIPVPSLSLINNRITSQTVIESQHHKLSSTNHKSSSPNQSWINTHNHSKLSPPIEESQITKSNISEIIEQDTRDDFTMDEEFYEIVDNYSPGDSDQSSNDRSPTTTSTIIDNITSTTSTTSTTTTTTTTTTSSGGVGGIKRTASGSSDKENTKQINSSGFKLEEVNSCEDDFIRAVVMGDGCSVRDLLSTGKHFNMEHTDKCGRTLLMVAVSSNNIDILKQLVTDGANVNTRHMNGSTALIHAAEKGNTEAVALLLEGGAFVNKMQCTGETALVKACKKGHTDIVHMLLEYGADIEITSNNEITPGQYAKIHNHLMCSDLLSKHQNKLTGLVEGTIGRYLTGLANIVRPPLFPVRCHSHRESAELYLSFTYTPQPLQPGSGLLLFLLHAQVEDGELQCRLHGPCNVVSVLLNSIALPPVSQGCSFVVSLIPKPGINTLKISLLENTLSNIRLIVAAYRVQLVK